MNILKVVGFIGHTSLLHQVSLPFSLRLQQKPLTTLWLVVGVDQVHLLVRMVVVEVPVVSEPVLEYL
jgi:hypothetical protein